MRQGLIAQDGEGVIEKEAGGIEDDENLGGEGFNEGLAGFLADAACDVGLMREKNLLEASQDVEAVADARGVPRGLSGAGTADGGTEFGGPGGIEFAEHFTRGGVDGSDAGDGEFKIGGHLRRSVRGRGL